MKTFSAKPLEVERKWHLIDAEGVPLGRLAVIAANLLRGKHKPQYTPNVDTGDFVIVINAEKVIVTGKKETGGFRSASFKELIEKDARLPIEKAVKGMLPHNTLGSEQFTKLKVYAGAEHPHEAQKPVKYEISKGEDK